MEEQEVVEVRRLLRQLNEEMGVNDTEIGFRLGIPASTIGSWRRGERRPAQRRLVIEALRRLVEERGE